MHPKFQQPCFKRQVSSELRRLAACHSLHSLQNGSCCLIVELRYGEVSVASRRNGRIGRHAEGAAASMRFHLHYCIVRQY